MDARIFSSGNDRSSFFNSTDNESKPARWRKAQHPIAAAILLSLFSTQYCAAEPIPRTQVKSFDAPDASQTWIEDINNSLTIIGQSLGAEDTSFVYRNGFREKAAPEYTYYGNNNKGQIIGAERRKTTDGDVSVGFIKTGDDIVYSVPGFGTDINDNGTIVGSTHGHVYIFKGDEPILFLEDEEDIDPRDEGGIHGATAYSVNNNDVVVGSYIVNGGGDGREHGFVYDHRTSSLGSIYHPSGQSTRPRGINNWGLIVGNHYPGDETSQGFAYFDGKYIPVEVGTKSTTVDGVNDWGFITGSYWDIGGDKEHAYIAHILPFIFWDQIN